MEAETRRSLTSYPFSVILAHVLAIGSFVFSITFVSVPILMAQRCLLTPTMVGLALGGFLSAIASFFAVGLARSRPELTRRRAWILAYLALLALVVSALLPMIRAMSCIIY